MDLFYLVIFILYSNFVFNNKIPRTYKNILKNQFIKLIILIILFNLINYNKKIGVLITIIFLITHNNLLNLTIDNNIL